MLAATATATDPTRATKGATQERAGPCEFTLITQRTEFDALEHEWNDLFTRAGLGSQMFQTFNWCWHWCNHYLDENAEGSSGPSLAIVTARRDGRLVLICPFVVERIAGLHQLNWLGAPVSQYGDVLIEDGPDALQLLHDAWRFIGTQIAPDVAVLRKVRDDAAIMPLLRDLTARSIAQLQAPYLDIASASDFETYEQRYSPRSRRNRRRLGRRLSERGETVFEHVTHGPRAREIAQQAIAMKRVWLQDRGLASPAFADPRLDAFFAAVAEAADHPVGCEVSALFSGGEATAIEIAFHAKDRILMHIIVFNLKYEKSGAGVLLLERTISDAFNGECRVFDLLAPADGYKLDWADATSGVNDWALPSSAKGWIFAHVYHGFARHAAKSVLNALPMGLRRAIVARFIRGGTHSGDAEGNAG